MSSLNQYRTTSPKALGNCCALMTAEILWTSLKKTVADQDQTVQRALCNRSTATVKTFRYNRENFSAYPPKICIFRSEAGSLGYNKTLVQDIDLFSLLKYTKAAAKRFGHCLPHELTQNLDEAAVPLSLLLMNCNAK